MKRLLKSFTPYQITYLSAVFLMTALFIILLPDYMLDDISNPMVVVCSVVATPCQPRLRIADFQAEQMEFCGGRVFY